jgi:polysaccharide biosynthesis/export protein
MMGAASALRTSSMEDFTVLIQTEIRRQAWALVLACAIALFTSIFADAHAQNIAEYRLGTGDKLRVTVFGQPDMSGEFAVDAAGQVTVPLVGAVDAARLTVAELTKSLTERLARDFLVDPKVSIDVLNYRPFYVLGEVKSPGSYAYVVGINIRQAIAIAGGFNRRAKTSAVTLYRDSRTDQKGATLTEVDRQLTGERFGQRQAHQLVEEEFEADLDAPVLPGDTIDVDRRLF